MHSAKEWNCFFGGMAAPEWNSLNKHREDPTNECSWLFKLEYAGNKYFYLFILMKESIFINGNVLTKIMLLLGINVYFIYFLSLKFKIWDLVLEFFFNNCEFNFIFIL